ncbi:toll/interleukin-1 receptor domain-containing protein, partial [Micromonospora rifamycinica]|uniref:toll/interleukin-1 receptor domain-containing protein n=1 Tax=Micromonospora rifamycinica TaxID=291594 RepID=UPI0012F78B03
MAASYDVFISYSGPNRQLARVIADGLQERGVKVWLDEWTIRPGGSIVAELRSAINAAKSYVVLFGGVPEGTWASAEREAIVVQAATNRRTLIPVKVGDSAAPPELRGRRYVDLTSWDPPKFQDAIDEIAHLVARTATPEYRPPDPANINPALRGAERRHDQLVASAEEAELRLIEAREAADFEQAGLAYHQLGIVAQERGDYEQA